MIFPGSVATLACVMLRCDRRRKRGRSLFLLLGMLAVLFALGGCGASAPQTPAGTYPVTITATSGALSKTATLNVVVP